MNDKSFMNKIYSNIGWVFGAKMLSMLFFVVTDLIIARRLGRNEYGEWSYFYSVLTVIFYIYWFGLCQSSKVYVAKETTEDGRASVVKTTLLLRLVTSLVFTLVFIPVSGYLARILGYPDKYPALDRLLLIGCVIAFGNSFLEYAKNITMGLKKFKQFFVCSIIEFALIMICVAIISIKACDVIDVGYAYAVANVIATVASIYIIVKLIKGKACFDKDRAKNIVIYAIPLVFLSIGGLIMMEMDVLMIGLIKGSEQVAVYSIAKSLTSKASQVNFSITSGAIQDFAIINNENRNEKYKQYRKIVRMNALITFGICALLLLFARIAILILYGREYIDAANIIYALIVYYFMLSVSNLHSNFLDFHGRANFRLKCYGVTVIINFVLNIVFIMMYGAMGAAIASGVSMIPYTVCLSIEANKIFKNGNLYCGEN